MASTSGLIDDAPIIDAKAPHLIYLPDLVLRNIFLHVSEPQNLVRSCKFFRELAKSASLRVKLSDELNLLT
ncbi:hypothetical protein HK104_010036 [Borealophlyctis nickersoniae]|nr:hypothetical protein HK104_010036 [Borealophlyctis nickersoniae]